jgi:hypothetical protein
MTEEDFTDNSSESLKGEEFMLRKIILSIGCGLTLSLFALAGEANAQDRQEIRITNVRQSASCTPAETECVDVAWQVTDAKSLITGYEVTVKIFYSEAGSNTGSRTVGGAARSAKVEVFHLGSGGLRSYEVTVKAFRLIKTIKTIVATGTRSGNF